MAVIIEELLRILDPDKSGNALSAATRARLTRILVYAAEADSRMKVGPEKRDLENAAAHIEGTLNSEAEGLLAQELRISPALREQLQLDSAWLGRLRTEYEKAPRELIGKAMALEPRGHRSDFRHVALQFRDRVARAPNWTFPLAAAAAIIAILFFTDYGHLLMGHKPVSVVEQQNPARSGKDVPVTGFGLGTNKGDLAIAKVPMSPELGRLINAAKEKGTPESRSELIGAIELAAANLPKSIIQASAVEITPTLYSKIDDNGNSSLQSITLAMRNTDVLILAPGD
jgi:hypothetical protein